MRGEVKLQRKKSEMARVRMKETLGSSLNFGVLKMMMSMKMLRSEPKMTMGR